jgi:hypothetical protein
MLLSAEMITGFNTDVQHAGQVYHVQTEDRGSKENPVLESLIYVGGTIIAQKKTPYAKRLEQGATEEAIATLLKKQHQVIIAAIMAGRIEDLVRHSRDETVDNRVVAPDASIQASLPPTQKAPTVSVPPPALTQGQPQKMAGTPAASSVTGSPKKTTGGLNLDQVISDYLRRSSEQGRLDLKVLTPNVFVAGKTVGLRVQISRASNPEPDAIVTVKIIGTAFKPQVFMGKATHDGIANFTVVLPSFTAGTAAIVIEAQSAYGRGELKHLIRRG